MRGRFITVEGAEGVGKTSNIDFIRDYLESIGKTVVVTREPGGTELGEKIRALLLDRNHNTMSDDTELLLMFAARSQHIHEVIQPALQKGNWVLCDRFTDATYAYQGGGRGVSSDRIEVLEHWVQQELQPDLTILLDLPVELGLQRAADRSTPDRFESEQVEFFKRVRDMYLQRAAAEPQRFVVIDASQELAAVQRDVETALQEYAAA